MVCAPASRPHWLPCVEWRRAASVVTVSWWTCASCRAKCVQRRFSIFSTNGAWWRRCGFVSQSRYAQRARRSRREWMGSSLSMRLKNAIARTFFSPARSAQTQSGPSPDQRFVGNRAHGRSECEEARSSALPFRANRRESAALEVGRWLLSAPLCSALRRFFARAK